MKTKITISAAVLTALLAAMLLTPGGVFANKINWIKYKEGLARAKGENKPIFLYFHADWCRYCAKMEKETFADATVSTYMNENFIPIMVDTEKERQIATSYGVRALPTNWFLASDGSKISTLPGYVDAKQLVNILKYIRTDSYQKMSFKDFLMQ